MRNIIMKSPTFALLIRKNIIGRGFRFGILMLCVAAVVGMLLSAELIDRSSRKVVEEGIARLGADVVGVPRGLSGVALRSFREGSLILSYMDSGILEKMRGYDFIETATPQIYLKSLKGATCCSVWEIFLIGYDPDTDFIIRPWLGKKNIKIGKDEVLAGPAVMTTVGAKLKFYNHNFRVAGVLDATGTAFDRAVFIPIEKVNEIIKSNTILKKKIGEKKISTVLIKLKDEIDGGLPRWKAVINIERDIEEITVIQPIKMVRKVHDSLKLAMAALQATSYSVWPITALLIALVFAMSTNERRREIGLYRAMGAKRFFVFRMIMTEAIVISTSGGILGIILSFPVVYIIYEVMQRPVVLPLYDTALCSLAAAGFSILTGALAALAPAVNISLKEPYDSIRRGE